MRAQNSAEPSSAGTRAEALLAWLGGGHWGEPGERHERSTHAVAGLIVLVSAALAWLTAALAVAQSTRWPMLVILPSTLLFGLLVGAVTRAVAGGPTRGWLDLIGRAAVAVGVGVVVGELAMVVLFAGSIDRHLDQLAARNADSSPAVVQASADLDRSRATRAALDNAVEQARRHRDEALVVARCEYNPTPGCPQTHITGVPGAGPETRTANQLLADAHQELDNTLATRDRRASELDAEIARAEQAVTQAHQAAIADADRGLGARWVAMNGYTLGGAGALALRLVAIAFFALLSLLPLILRLWRGETSHDRVAAAHAQRERAELQADTAIAVKRAEVRAAAEIMWADQQLASARLAVDAQTEIDREQHRRRVAVALDAPVPVRSQRSSPPVEEDMYLPIAAEAEAASLKAAQLTPAQLPAAVDESANLQSDVGRSTSLIPTIPDVTKAAARWIRPLVPPFVARAIDTTAHPLRTARKVFEEVEEITFSLKRTHKITVDAQESPPPQVESVGAADTAVARRRVEASIPAGVPVDDSSFELAGRERQSRLAKRDELGELDEPDRPRQLPPAQ